MMTASAAAAPEVELAPDRLAAVGLGGAAPSPPGPAAHPEGPYLALRH
jgi:hypothetical protein